MFLLKSIGFEWANKILVSSTKIIGAEVLFTIFGKLFMYKRKSRGKKIAPCGTPCLTLAQYETLLLFSLSLYSILLFYNICYPDKTDTVENPCHRFHTISI